MTDITPDPTRVYIAEIREDLRSGYSEAAADRIREQHIPALLAAVEAVLIEHSQDRVEWCKGCGFAWPCRTYRAISRELPGETPGA